MLLLLVWVLVLRALLLLALLRAALGRGWSRGLLRVLRGCVLRASPTHAAYPTPPQLVLRWLLPALRWQLLRWHLLLWRWRLLAAMYSHALHAGVGVLM